MSENSEILDEFEAELMGKLNRAGEKNRPRIFVQEGFTRGVELFRQKRVERVAMIDRLVAVSKAFNLERSIVKFELQRLRTSHAPKPPPTVDDAPSIAGQS